MLAALTLWSMASALVLLPLLPALAEWRLRSDVAALPVPHKEDGNIRYAAMQFRSALETTLNNALAQYAPAGGMPRIPLPLALEAFARPKDCSHPGGFLLVGMAGCPKFSNREWQQQRCAQTLLAAAPLSLPPGFIFSAAIYARDGMTSDANSSFNTVLSETSLQFGDNSTVLDWAHATHMRVASGGRLWGCVSADSTLIVAAPCHFTRLAAARIEFGNARPGDAFFGAVSEANGKRRIVRHLPHQLTRDLHAARTLVDGMVLLPDDSLFEGHLIAYQALKIGKRARVTGSVKSHGALVIGAGAMVHGAAVSRARLSLGSGAHVHGPLIAEHEIRLQRGCVVGEPKHPTSISAPRIVIEHGALVFGTVSARESGELIA